MGRLLQWVVVLAVCWGAWQHWRQREVVQTPGMVAPREPRQQDLDGSKAFRKGDYELTALASYDIEARLLRRERYRADAGAPLSPLDFALGWGPMSDTDIISRLEIDQGARYYTYRWQGEPPIPPQIIAATSANTHLIPASGDVFAQLDGVRPGQVVRLGGYLVSVQGPGGFTWKSSLTRNDTGAGACELFYVETVEVRS
jgi:hypothetical protein